MHPFLHRTLASGHCWSLILSLEYMHGYTLFACSMGHMLEDVYLRYVHGA
ncbi:hypothetical protein DAI22_05g108400 [Oryza sativa Japonica Group]|nr:hypothetical protein DAI22_05g108400 [Oryza sativa Japonica Group]